MQPTTGLKAYLAVTGFVFALVTVLHIWRMVAENRGLATDPVFLILTVLTTGLCVWAVALFRGLKSSGRPSA
jgi:hypothetical protein